LSVIVLVCLICWIYPSYNVWSSQKEGEAELARAYLHYLWIHNLAETRNEVIYIPTEANLPILEAGRRNSIKPEK
jgi:hypothetical protein